jgi:hypothetical protein
MKMPEHWNEFTAWCAERSVHTSNVDYTTWLREHRRDPEREHEALIVQRGLRALLGHDVDVCVEDRVVVLDFTDVRTLVRLAFASGIADALPPVHLTIPTTTGRN